MSTWEAAAVAGLVACHVLLTVTATLDKCNTYDEIAHLTAGYSYWREGDYRLQPENGNWPQRWAGLALLVDGAKFPSLDRPTWRSSNVWELGKEFFFELGNDPAALLLRGRAMIAVLGAILCLLVYFRARAFFGISGALLSLVLCTFCPTLLAHGGLVTSDIAAALCFLAVLWSSWHVLHDANPASVLVSGVALAALFLSKFSAVIIVPVLLTMTLVRFIDGRALRVKIKREAVVTDRRVMARCFFGIALCQLVVVWSFIWLSYGLHSHTFRGTEGEEFYPKGWAYVMDGLGPWAKSAVTRARVHEILPESYLFGFAYTLRHQKRSAFLNGERSTDGWAWFFPFAFLVKTPLATLGILLLAALAVRIPRSRREWQEAWHRWYDIAPLWIFLVIFWLFAVASHLNIGHRHVLPVYPILYVLAGAALNPWRDRSSPVLSKAKLTLTMAALAVCVGWLAAESLYRWPHYLAYFNQIVGGPVNGYKHLVDSSLDWGQDLPGLKRWLARHPAEPVYLDYFGSGSPHYYVPQTTRLPIIASRLPAKLEPLCPGLYCISATSLQRVYERPWDDLTEQRYRFLKDGIETYDDVNVAQAGDETLWLQRWNEYHEMCCSRLCRHLRTREPDDNVGYSILIYRVSADDLAKAIAN